MKPSTAIARAFVIAGSVFAASVSVHAQGSPVSQTGSSSTAVTNPDEEKNKEKAVELDPFIVKAENEQGYYAETSTAGARYNKRALDIAGSIGIVNHQLIEDMAATDLVQPVMFGISGVTRQSRHDFNLTIRGFRTNTSLRNGIRNSFNAVPTNSYETERIEVIKGPAGLITGINSSNIGGLVNSITYQPTEDFRGFVNLTLSDHSYWRATTNISGPLYKGDDVQVLYRLTLGRWKAGSYKPINYVDETFYGGSIRFKFGQRTVLTIDASDLDRSGYDYFSQPLERGPDGKTAVLSSVIPESFSFARPEDVDISWKGRPLVFDFAHTFNKVLSTRLNFTKIYEDAHYVEMGGSYNPNFTANRTFVDSESIVKVEQLQFDLVAKYDVSFLKNETSAGYDLQRLNNYSAPLWLDTTTMPVISMTNPDYSGDAAAIAAIYAANAPLTTPSRTKDPTASYYGQHSITFWKDRVTLVGAIRHIIPGDRIATNYSLSGAPTSFSESNNRPELNVHKYGLIFKPLPTVSVYYADATNFFPQSGILNGGTPYQFTQHDSLGQLYEGGVKFQLLGGKLGGSLTYFDLARTNVRVDTPDSYVTPQGQTVKLQAEADTTSKGWEADVFSRLPVRNFADLDLIATFYDAHSLLASGKDADYAPTYITSFVAKLTFTHGPLKGFSFGGTTRKQSRATGSGGGYIIPSSPWNGDVFASYTLRERYSVQLNVTNVSNSRYIITGGPPAVGALGANGQTNEKRRILLGFTYRL